MTANGTLIFDASAEIYDPDTDRKGIADLIVAKHRNGPVGTVHLRFFDRTARFADLDPGDLAFGIHPHPEVGEDHREEMRRPRDHAGGDHATRDRADLGRHILKGQIPAQPGRAQVCAQALERLLDVIRRGR